MSKPFIVLLLMSVVLVSTVSARNWKKVLGGRIRWDHCNHTGSRIKTAPIDGRGSSSEKARQCGGLCITLHGCMAFTVAGSTCYLERRNGNVLDSGATLCGLVE